MFNHSVIKRGLAVGLISLVAAFPAAAQAMVVANPGGSVSASQVPATGPQPSQGGYGVPGSSASTTTQSGSSFQWGDAGIGAGVAVLLVGAAAAAGTMTRRRRRPALS